MMNIGKKEMEKYYVLIVLENSWVWSLTFERYDAGGHYYFKPIEKWENIL